MRTLAIHLPQFHPVPDNDAWWGRGFTEWTNVTRAKPLFRGHEQPRLPADLGFVDLRLPEARAAQAEMAARYGIDGFCYYHYWFEGRRLLERPVDEILRSGEPDFPFTLCWANETWSRRWLGEEREILLAQTYSAEDHARHARWLARVFADRRYVRVDGRPLFLVYRPMHIPELERSIDIYRTVVQRELGIDPYLVGVDSHHQDFDFRSVGFDDTMNFRPRIGLLPALSDDNFGKKRFLRNARRGIFSGRLNVIDYERFTSIMDEAVPTHGHCMPSVFVGWDNTARRGEKGLVVLNGTPALFQQQLERAIAYVSRRPPSQQILFVNAWNEWAEGNYLEPDQRNGDAYLRALQEVLSRHRSSRPSTAVAAPAEPPQVAAIDG